MIFLLLSLLLVCSLFIYGLVQKIKQRRILLWEKELRLQKHILVFEKLYEQVNGFMLSRQARQKHDSIEYTYGEIEFLPFIALLSLTRLNSDTVFYDLGCGTGKAVLACAMVYPIRKSIGVEVFSELFNSACAQAKKLEQTPSYTGKANKIEFILGNFLDVDLASATVIFINSSVIIGSTWDSLCEKLNQLPHLTQVITTSKPLQSSHFDLSARTKVKMSWGVVFAYIHSRKTNMD